METITIDEDIKVFYVTARSFPDGIQEAVDILRSVIPPATHRRMFGLSRPENGGAIVYRAGAEELPGETMTLKLPGLVIKKGKYVSDTLKDFLHQPALIGETFGKLLHQAGIDPQGYCVEWYSPDQASVRCMVRLKD